MLKRIGLSVPEELDELLNESADEERRPKSEVIRIALEEYFANRGKKIDTAVRWGGVRKPTDKASA